MERRSSPPPRFHSVPWCIPPRHREGDGEGEGEGERAAARALVEHYCCLLRRLRPARDEGTSPVRGDNLAQPGWIEGEGEGEGDSEKVAIQG